MVTWRALAFALLCLPASARITPALAAQNDHSEPSAPHSSKSSDVSAATSPAPASGISIAVADFSGADKELGRFLADTLLTDLAQSERLRMVERAEIGKALTELKLQSTGLAEPQDIKKVGRLLGADRLIVGSYLVRDGQMLINARLLDVRTGRVTSGGAANVTGNRDNVLPLVHQLAHRFHKRVTGAELLLENERVSSAPVLPSLDNAPDGGGEPRAVEPEPRAVEPDRSADGDVSSDRSRRSADGYNVRQPEDTSLPASSPTAPSRLSAPPVAAQGGYNGYSAGYNGSVPPLFTVPASVSPLRPVTSGDISRLVGQAGGGNASRFFTSGSASLSVSRLRALVALVRAGGYPVPASAADPRGLAGLIPDANQVPLWAVGPVAVAVRRGLWPLYHALHPADSANWGFVGAVIDRLNAAARLARSRGARPGGAVIPAVVSQARGAAHAGASPAVFPVRPLSPDAEAPASPASTVLYTGLLVEARDFPVQRTMSARIVDTSGRQVYPDPKNVPDIDYVEDHGMADYYHSGADARRAGDHPLVVRAVAISGDAIVISVEAADRLLSENRRDGFLRLWRVGILLDEGR